MTPEAQSLATLWAVAELTALLDRANRPSNTPEQKALWLEVFNARAESYRAAFGVFGGQKCDGCGAIGRPLVAYASEIPPCRRQYCPECESAGFEP